MAEVITRLKVDNQGYDQKIRNAQRSLDQFGLKGTEVGQKMSGLGRVLTTNIGSLSKWSVGLGAASAALKVAGDAFKHNEQLMDDWNGTVEGAKAVYDSFLTSLNTGDFSGFFSRMGAVAAAAREAYEALDKLGTYNAFNQINLGKARTGLTEALAGYRTGEVDKAGVEAAATELKKQLQERQELEFEAYMKAIGSKAKSAGVDSDLLSQYLQGSYGDYEAVKATQLPTKSEWNSSTRSFVDKYDMEAATPLQKLGQMLRQLNDEELQNLQALGAQAENTANEIANVDKQVGRVLSAENKKTTETKAAKAETPWYEKANSFGMNTAPMTEIADLVNQQKMYQTMLSDLTNFDTSEEYQEVAAALADINEQIERWKLGQAFICDEIEDTAEAAKDAGTNHIKAADATGTAWTAAASSVSQLGSAIGQLGGEEFNIAGVIAQAIANVALGLGQALSTKNHETTSPWEWIAAAISGTATMVGTIASIKSATSGYANGGLVLPNGSPYQGDNIVARLNAGEGVLTQQGIANAAALADGSGFGALTLRTEVSGESLAIVLDNNNRRRGRGKTIR